MTDVDSVLNLVQAKHKNLASRDIQAAIGVFKDLFPKPETYVFSDGINRMLFTLTGTIPVNYKGSTYHIPICIYLMDTHPYHPPLVYVRPTADMRVAPSKFVDSAGRVYLPYLHEWKQGKSDLYSLINILVMVFGESCPVFSKRSSSSSQLSTQPSNPPPYPAGGVSMPMPGTNPAYPSYPSSGMPYPMPSYNSQSCGVSMPMPGTNPAYPSYPSSGMPYPMPSYNSQSSTTSNPPIASESLSGSSNPGYNTQFNTGNNTITNEHIRASVMSAVEDKIRRRLRETLGSKAAELQTIKTTRDDLNKGKQRVDGLGRRMMAEQERLEKSIMSYQDMIEKMDKILANAQPSDEMPIDECIDTTAPLYSQLFKAFTKDNAMDDCIYVLFDALRDRKIDIESYLKCVRRLSREMFKIRLTIIKCRRKAGLD